MVKSSFTKTIKEPDRETSVCREADVVVVGGGPAGVGAAIAAARAGADTVLVERYGHLGGLATGGLVLCIMPMSDGTNEQQIAGLCQEIIDRLDDISAAIHPRKEDLGSSDKKLVDFWRYYPFTVIEGKIRLSAQVDPEMLKCILNDMAEEAQVKLYLHSWGTRAIVDKDEVKGVIFESKSGRQAILGKVIIDTTGDGDIFASAGARFDGTIDPKRRSANLALVSRIGNIDYKQYAEFRESDTEKYRELINQLQSQDGLTMYIRTSREDVIWVNNNIPGLNGLNVEDLTWLEVNVRKRILLTHDFLKRHMPGFENCYIMDTASQAGVRTSRRLIGEYVLTEQDINSGVIFDDTIAVCPSCRRNVSAENPHMHIPYRTLLPQKVENLLVAGRCFSSDIVANDVLAPIQFCIAMGQAAGTAAALAVKTGIKPREVDYRTLQDRLLEQAVPLPDILKPNTNK